jgi:hypothetical protein
MFKANQNTWHLPTRLQRLNVYVGKAVVIEIITGSEKLQIRETLTAVGPGSITVTGGDGGSLVIPVIGHKCAIRSVICEGYLVYLNKNAERQGNLMGPDIFYALEYEGFSLTQ